MKSAIILGLLGGAVLAHTEHDVARIALRSNSGLQKRQVSYCSGEGTTCEEQCGPGYETCEGWPYCFKPGDGQICCSDGGRAGNKLCRAFH